MGVAWVYGKDGQPVRQDQPEDDRRPPKPALVLDDEDAIDSLHILPLSALPLHTHGLTRAALVKTSQMQSMVRLFQDKETGTGIMPIDKLGTVFRSNPEGVGQDIGTLRRLGSLPSFDVYTLRMELRRLDVDVGSLDALRLSHRKQIELAGIMRRFTRPLVQTVFAGEPEETLDDDIIDMVMRPDRPRTMSNLRRISKTLDVGLFEIPQFLEEYGDIALSLAYFRGCLEQIRYDVEAFLDWQSELDDNFQVKNNENIKKTLLECDKILTFLVRSLEGRFSVFDRLADSFWDDVSPTGFRELSKLVRKQHTCFGGVLCGMGVKLEAWKSQFHINPGGSARRLDFIRTEMHPGLNRLKVMEERARKALNAADAA